MRLTYLDHAATTPMLSEAIDAMLPWLRDSFGNPSGVHAHARAARKGLEEARDRFATVVGCTAREVVFTGGGTEALNFALRGIVREVPDGVLAISAIEHDAVRNTGAALARTGREVVELPVDRNGVLDVAATLAADLLDERVTAVAVMAVNNEVGTVQPIIELVELVRERCPNARIVVDAVQALSWLDVRPIVAVADLVAFSAHKFGGPKGVGALVVKEGTAIEPILHGGGQERDRRSGTQNVAGIAAMAVAAELTDSRRDDTVSRVVSLRDRLVDGLVGGVPDLLETSLRSTKVAGNAHLRMSGVESEEVLVLLDAEGICASAGSACASGALHVSPVLLAMGVPKEEAGGALRLTLGAASTDEDVDHALRVIPEVLERLR